MNTHQIIQEALDAHGDFNPPKPTRLFPKPPPHLVRVSKAIANLLGRPVAVGGSLARQWPEAEYLDGRPAVMAETLNLSVGQTARIYVTAIEAGLWKRGYGSPASPSVQMIQYCLHHKCIAEVKTINRVFGGYNNRRLPRNAARVARLAIQMKNALRRLGEEHTSERLGLILCAVKAYLKLNRRPSRKHKWAVLGALKASSTKDEFYKNLSRELKRPYYQLINNYASKKFLWEKLVGIPQVDFRCNVKPGSVKYIRRFLKETECKLDQYVGDGDKEHIVVLNDMLLPLNNIVTAFGAKSFEILKIYRKTRPDIGTGAKSNRTLIHDLGQFVVSNPARTEEAGTYIICNRKVLKNPSVDFSDVFLLLNNWSPELKKLKWSAAVKEARKIVYQGVDKEIAKVAAELSLTQHRASQYQTWIKKNKKKSHEVMPYVEVAGAEVSLQGDWKFYKLEKDDLRGPLLGLYTNCCQHPDGAGAFCAQHGWSNPLGGFFVVEYKGQIVAQSWAWIAMEHSLLCFDNIETLSSAYGEGILALYKKAAAKLSACFDDITVGEGYSDIELEGLRKCEVSHIPDSLDYSDAVIQYSLLEK